MNVFHFVCAMCALLATASADAGRPLLLTPYINRGQLLEARNLSRVGPLFHKVESYSGYLTVNETAGSHLFFWFFPKNSTSSPKNSTYTPVVLWLGGGPGMSSLISLFQGTGPFRVENRTILKRNRYSWTRSYHMLYIDQPVGTGFSFTAKNGSIFTTDHAARQLHAALLQFFQLFSEFRQNAFYLAGESYAGKFIPATGYRIHKANQNPGSHRINLQGMMMGNGFIDPENMLDFDKLFHATGLIDEHEGELFRRKQKSVKRLIQAGNWTDAYNEYYRDFIRDTIIPTIGSGNYYDYRSSSDDGDYFQTNAFHAYLTNESVREQLHVGQAQFYAFNDDVALDFMADSLKTVRPLIEKLLKHYPMLFYSGQYDIVCGPLFIENSLNKLKWDRAADFYKSKKRLWRKTNKLVGHYKTVGNLVFLTVRDAGHSVTMEQPQLARHMADIFVHGRFR